MSHLAPLILLMATSACLAALDCPLHPDERAVVDAMMEAEAVSTPFASSEPPGWLRGGIIRQLEADGVAADEVAFWSLLSEAKPGMVLTFAYRGDGRTLAIAGNGPWLRNQVIERMAAMPELRSLRIDHNVRPDLGWDHPEYSGAGLAALADSKLRSLKIGHGFNDDGLAAVAKIRALRELVVGHSRISEEGLAVLAEHPGLEAVAISEMGRFTGIGLAAIATIPGLRELGYREAYLTYDAAFVHLAGLGGRLERIDLGMCVVPPEDLERLRQDHTAAEVVLDDAESIARQHIGVARKLVRIAPEGLTAELAAAVERRAAEKAEGK